MDFDKVKKFLSLFLLAFGIFVLIFISFSIYVINRTAQKKHEIKKDYAGELVTPGPTITP